MHLAFYRHRGLLADRAIRLVTRSRYSHVEIVDGDPRSYAKQVSYAATKRDGGTVRQKIMTFAEGHWDCVRVDGDWTVVMDALGRPYDVRGAVLSAPRGRCGWPTPGHEFCSGLAARAIGLPFWWTYNPGELAEAVGLPMTITTHCEAG